jgi:DnaJ family protein A protein 2
VVQQKEHAVFKRKGADLFFEKTLTLAEALCGFKFAIPHLDGRQLLVSSREGDVIKPGCFKAVYDEGMPVWQRSVEKGRLFIQFDVVFPEPGDLGDKEIAALAALLPPRPILELDLDSCQEVGVSDINMEQELLRERERQAEEEGEDDPRSRVQCAQQ